MMMVMLVNRAVVWIWCGVFCMVSNPLSSSASSSFFLKKKRCFRSSHNDY